MCHMSEQVIDDERPCNLFYFACMSLNYCGSEVDRGKQTNKDDNAWKKNNIGFFTFYDFDICPYNTLFCLSKKHPI